MSPALAVICLLLVIQLTSGNQTVTCSIQAQAYSAFGNRPSCPKQTLGFVELNGGSVWRAGWCTSFPNLRGINTMIVDPFSCTVSDVRRFDTWNNEDAATDLLAYLQWIRDGAIILGVTGDEPRRFLASALPTLKAAGVSVGDVQLRGNFVFVLQKGYPEKTVLVKSATNEQLTSLLKVAVEGSSIDDLKFRPV